MPPNAAGVAVGAEVEAEAAAAAEADAAAEAEVAAEVAAAAAPLLGWGFQRRADNIPATANRWAEGGGEHHHHQPPPLQSLHGAAFNWLIPQPPQDPPRSTKRRWQKPRRSSLRQ